MASRLSPLLVTALLLALAGGYGRAEPMQLSELILAPAPAEKSGARAADQRSRARAYQGESNTSGITLPITEEEVEGILAPRSRPEGRATNNRARARGYQQGNELPAAIVPPSAGDRLPDGNAAAERARDNRARARAQVSTSGPLVIERIGSDGIPIVSCKDVDNVAGRIGDDAQPGSVIFVMRDGKPFKVRCQ